jgi:amino acid transporter
MIGAGIAFSIVSSRMWFAMGRAGALPAWFASIHPTHHTPSNATWAQIGLFFVVGLGGAALVGIDNVYLVGGLVTVFAAIIIYVAANTGLTLHMWTRRRAEFRWLSHGAFPAISTAVLIALFYKSLFPIPATPIVYAPIIVGVWLLLGLLIVFVLRLSGREDWLQRAAAATEQSSLETSNATS